MRSPVHNLLIIFLSLANLYFIWDHFHNQKSKPTAPIGVSIPAIPAPEVKALAKVVIPIKTHSVKAYPASVKGNIKLPALVVNDPTMQVISSTQVPADHHPQTTTVLLNTDTGETQTYYKRDSLPLFAWDTHGDIGLYGGIKNGQPAIKLLARQGVMQVKALHLGGMVSVDQPLSGSQPTDLSLWGGGWLEW